MKVKNVLFFLGVSLFGACTNDGVDPAVETISVYGGYEVEREKAFPNLYNYYVASSKNKEYYEVISKGDFILNYYPKGQLLTICADQGSGWLSQYKDIDESDLKKFVDDGVTFDQVSRFGTLDNDLDSSYNSILIETDPFIEVKTNGSPR
ncbi:hypothetical protein J2Y45_003224 [Dyadobacter sp. BE34]|uniref:Lipoprotein n=1 Tax=Dyadobacter fermentans TaxID=94254 RepID=A0ABU1QY09_9BACT|nr:MULTISPECIES: hypothetical protein [Dyadobacter]MDR6806032.1 hypothetical protein [Dyadobacter fermentans]MDR7043773.1 hypothetical protein [Dyadobacter sp. BE242]MDR7198084.1 hypothetical protein [Dyadobacter sp. BE34]MDR7216047.1 hypothetical protein [Dyadobacter sp. BE31]MDR7264427.1 hypothetical protein [Dyadobacter sp. BE32]